MTVYRNALSLKHFFACYLDSKLLFTFCFRALEVTCFSVTNQQHWWFLFSSCPGLKKSEHAQSHTVCLGYITTPSLSHEKHSKRISSNNYKSFHCWSGILSLGTDFWFFPVSALKQGKNLASFFSRLDWSEFFSTSQILSPVLILLSACVWPPSTKWGWPALYYFILMA